MSIRSWSIPVLTGLVANLLFAQTPAAPPPKPAATTPAPAPAREPGLYAIILTTQGTIVAKLFEKEAPITVRNITGLASATKSYKDPKTGQMMRKRFYDGLTFHRVIPGFMIQGGDPLGTGAGGTEVIKDEFSPSLKFDVPGRLAMANAGPNTGSCQFFITDVPTPHLDGQHTIFGQVMEGQDIVTKITKLPRDGDDKPRIPVKIIRFTVKREGAAPASEQKKATTVKKAAPPAAKKTTTPPAAKQ